MKINYILFTETKWTRRGALALFFGLAMICVLLLSLQAAKPAQAAGATFTVNSTADPGDGTCNATECTLREAITAANRTSAADTIKFNIPSSDCEATTHVCTISPGSALPQITKRVTIDGYTQPRATENTIPLAKDGTNALLMVELDGTNAGSHVGLELDSGFNGADASNSVIRGLVINHGFFFGIFLSGGTGYKIEGNFIGTDPSGTAAEGNLDGVSINRTSNSTIGGTSPADRNLISGNSSDGIDGGGSGNKIEGNLIGTKADGSSNLGNRRHGMLINSPSNTIGDSDPTDGATNAANTIAFNVDTGVAISEDQSVGNRILSNSIFSNGDLGIDLFGGTEDADGVTANDPKDPDTGPNRLQNHPEIISATTFPTFTRITGTLESTPSTRHKKRTFIIQFFSSPSADSSGYGEGQTFLGQIQVKTDRNGVARDANGNSPFSFTPSQKVAVGQFITATATNKKTGDTSEFSNAREVEPPVIGGGG